MIAPAPQCQPSCATPPEDLIRLAGVVEDARLAYLDAYLLGIDDMQAKEEALRQVLWDDKGTWGPALRQAAQVATLIDRVKELEAALRPFVRHYEPWMDQWPDKQETSVYPRHTFGELRAARAALQRGGA